MKRLLSLGVVLAWTAVSWATPPKLIVPPQTAKTCSPVFVVPDTDAIQLVWDAPEEIEFIPTGKLANKLELGFFCRKAGEYTITVVGSSKEGEMTLKKFKVTFIAGTDPAPPTPQPTPPPEPAPIATGPLFVYFVENTLDAAKIKAQLFASGQPLRTWQDAGKHKVTAMPINTDDPSLARFAQSAKDWMAKGNKLPYLIVLRLSGPNTADKVWEGATPDDPAKILEILKKAEGK